jgi:hemerythrin
MLITWEPAFEIGIEVIDHDHMTVVEVLNRLIADPQAGRSVIDQHLATLESYVLRHFGREEGLMAAAAYPDFAEHKASHDEFRATVAKMRRDFHEGVAVTLQSEIVVTLMQWWMNHIRRVDPQYKPWLARRT